jgi:hypothetical protein
MGIGLGVGINRSNYAQGIFSAYQSRVVADGGVTEAGACVDAVSGLLQSASLLIIPSGYKGGKAYAEIPTNGNGDLTWTRASTALRTNSSGLLESMGSGVPRLSYMYGSCPALLLEPQRTNLCLYSQTFGDSSWTALNSTKVSTNNTDPSATNTALNVTWGTGGSKYFYRTQTGLTIGTTYTITFYVKSSNASKFRIYAESLGFTSANFTTTSDFQRFQLTYTATVTSGTFGLQAASDNTAADLIVAFAQFEAGSYSSTYTPTTTASATRVADTATKTGVSSLIGQSEGTIFIDIYFTQLSNAGFRAFFSLEGNTANQFSGITPQTTNNGNDISYAGTNYTLTTGRHKIICTYSQTNNQRKLFVDGVLRATSTHTNFSATIDRYSVGCRINPFSAFDLDRQLSSDSGVLDYAMFNSLLTDAQCVSLTTL